MNVENRTKIANFPTPRVFNAPGEGGVNTKMPQRYLYTVHEESGIPSRQKRETELAVHCRADLVTECSYEKDKNTNQLGDFHFRFSFRCRP